MKKYKTILADPPWDYNQKLSSHKTTRGGAIQHYSLMSLEEIKKFPVPDLLDKDAMFWLWVTNSFIHEGLHLLEFWGLQYKTMATWVKNIFGLGYWLRGQTEHILLGVKGKPRSKMRGPHGASGLGWSTIIYAKRTRHSEKPEGGYQMIEALGEAPRLELFARYKREGWDSWGDEIKENSWGE